MTSKTTIDNAIKKAIAILKNSKLAKDFATSRPYAPDINSFKPRLESEILLSNVLDKPRIFLHTNGNLPIFKSRLEAFFTLVESRANGVPIEYLTKKVNFYKHEFFIDYGALIPRSDTEILLECAMWLMEKIKLDSIAEVGIGSGALACSLALEKKCHIYATDISQDALKIARKNIEKFNLGACIEIAHTSLLGDKKDLDLVISNPPYISSAFKPQLPLSFEPDIALFGGKYGFEVIFALIEECVQKNVRFLVCEIGFNQCKKIEQKVRQITYKEITFHKDLNGFDRVFTLQFF